MFETHPVDLPKLLDDASAGKIQLPDFQRGWVWDDDRIKGLLSSISRRFPIGIILTLESGGEINLGQRVIEGVEADGAIGAEEFLLDGQQRLTSLYQSLKHQGPVNTRNSRNQQIERWYYIDMMRAMDPSADRDDAIISVPANRKETSNFGQEVVRDLSTQDLEYHHHMMPTERLLDAGTEWEFQYRSYWERNGNHPKGDPGDFLNKFSASIKDAFRSYAIPVTRLGKETTKEAVCTVFEKVNQGGVPLGTFELVTATLASNAEGFSLRDDWRERKVRLHGNFPVLQGIEGDQFLQLIALLATQEHRREAERQNGTIRPVSCKKDAILNLSLKDYQNWADKVTDALESAARFLNERYIFTQKDVPYNAQIVPLAALHAELGNELETETRKTRLARWFWSIIFAEDYGNAVETKSASDLVEVANWIRGGELPGRLNEASFEPARMIRLTTRTSAAYKGLYALLLSAGSDWRNGNPMSWDIFTGTTIDIHHIFPAKWCQRTQPAIPKRLYNSIINKTPIDGSTNRKIGAKAPSSYLQVLWQNISVEALSAVLYSHRIDPEHLSSDDFEKHFVARGQALLDMIGDAMGKQLPNGHDTFVEALNPDGRSAESEDDDEDEFDPVVGHAYDDDDRIVAAD